LHKIVEEILVRKKFPYKNSTRPSWKDVEIIFYVDQSQEINDVSEVSISVNHHKKERFTFSDLGMNDKRSSNKPNNLWDILITLAKTKGYVNHAKVSGKMTAATLKTQMTKLKKILRQCMDVDEDPFHSYDRKNDNYLAKFKISFRNSQFKGKKKPK